VLAVVEGETTTMGAGAAAIGAAHGSRGSGCRRRRGERFIGRTLVPHRWGT
jgi:hypothetical protein